MKLQISNALVSDVLFVIGGGLAIAAMWLIGWRVGLLGTGLGLVVLAGVLRGVDLVGKGGRKR